MMHQITQEPIKIVRHVSIPGAGAFTVELEPIGTSVFKARCRFEELPNWWHRTVTAKLGWMESPATVDDLIEELARECWAAITSKWVPDSEDDCPR